MRSPVRFSAYCLFLLIGGLVFGPPVQAQERSLDYRVFTTVQGAVGGSIPFWHYANTRGQLRPGSTTNGLSGAALVMPFQDNGGVDVSVGAEAVGRISDASNTLHALQLYGKLQYRGLRLSVGRFPETIAGHEAELSMGSMMVSRNAPPVPKIKLATPQFLDVPFTGGHLQFRARWSDGQLGEDRHVASPFLHQKTFYLKINVENVALLGGGIHNMIWGGEGRSYGVSDYAQHVLLALPTQVDEDVSRGGNSVAAYDFGLRYSFGNWQIRASRLFYLEDTVSLRFRSPWDGVWGLGLRRIDGRGWIDAVLYEHMNTIQQDALPNAPPGRASYYNHFVYESGWTYKGTVLGNPLLVFDPGQEEVVNNMIIAHHLGIRGTPTPRFGYSMRLTYSRNYGVCEDQIISGTCHIVSHEPVPPNQKVRPRGALREDQYSVEGEIRYHLSEAHHIHFLGSAAVDLGSFYNPRWGLQLGLQWDGTVDLP